jgi:hypothetical protein
LKRLPLQEGAEKRKERTVSCAALGPATGATKYQLNVNFISDEHGNIW